MVFVLVEAFNNLLRKLPDLFRINLRLNFLEIYSADAGSSQICCSICADRGVQHFAAQVARHIPQQPGVTFTLIYLSQAQAALMYDAVFVLVEAFNKLLRKKPDMFRNNLRRGQIFNNGSRGIDCNTSRGWVTPWEHGDKISRFLRKVSSIELSENYSDLS